MKKKIFLTLSGCAITLFFGSRLLHSAADKSEIIIGTTMGLTGNIAPEAKSVKKGIELINITSLCTPKLGCSGLCNDFNEPEEESFHIQVWYRGEVIANIMGNQSHVIDDDKYLIHVEDEGDFIIYRKVKQ